MFENGGREIGSVSACAPDYERQAEIAKKKLDSTVKLKKELVEFMGVNDSYRFSKIASMAELVGGLVIIEDEQSRHLEAMLSKMESA